MFEDGETELPLFFMSASSGCKMKLQKGVKLNDYGWKVYISFNTFGFSKSIRVAARQSRFQNCDFFFVNIIVYTVSQNENLSILSNFKGKFWDLDQFISH